MSRSTEARIGLIVGAVALIAIGATVFAPAVYMYGTNWVTAGTMSLWDAGIETNAVIYLAVMIVAALSVGAGAFLCSREIRAPGLTLLWAGATALTVDALLTLPGADTAVVPSVLHTGAPDSVGIGVYLILPALAALATAVTDTVVRTTPRRPAVLRPH